MWVSVNCVGTLCGCSMLVENVGDGPVSANIIWVLFMGGVCA